MSKKDRNSIPVALPIPKMEGRLDVHFNVPTPPVSSSFRIRARVGEIDVEVEYDKERGPFDILNSIDRLLKVGVEREERTNHMRAAELEAKRLEIEERKAALMLARKAAKDADQ